MRSSRRRLNVIPQFPAALEPEIDTARWRHCAWYGDSFMCLHGCLHPMTVHNANSACRPCPLSFASSLVSPGDVAGDVAQGGSALFRTRVGDQTLHVSAERACSGAAVGLLARAWLHFVVWNQSLGIGWPPERVAPTGANPRAISWHIRQLACASIANVDIDHPLPAVRSPASRIFDYVANRATAFHDKRLLLTVPGHSAG